MRTWNDYNPWSGLPGGPLINMLMQIGGSSLANSLGGTPMGYRQGGDFYSTLRQQQVTQAHYENMRRAAQEDMQLFMPLAEKAAREAGVPFTDETRADVEKAFQSASGFLAYMSPQTYDKLTGGASKSNLMHGAYATGQLMVDPVTGFRGMSAESASIAAEEMYQQYKYADPTAWRKETAGLTSLEMRDLHSELQRRGLGANSLLSDRERVTESLGLLSRHEDRAATFRRAGVDENRAIEDLTDTDIDKLLGDENVQIGMRAGLGDRIKKTTDKYKGAIAAVKDIFGANGRQDAPMAELFSALEALTNNSLSQLDTGRVERMVRNMGSIAAQTNIGLGEMQMIFGQGNQLAKAYGLNEAFVPGMAMNAMGWRGAYSAAQFGPTWGMQSADELMQLGMAREAAAGASEISNRAGMLLRLAEERGGLSGRAAEAVEAARRGDLGLVDDLMNMSQENFIRTISAGSGLSTAALTTELDARSRNQEYALPYDVASQVKSQYQVKEIIDKTIARPGERPSAEVATRLQELGAGLTTEQRLALANELSVAGGATIANMIENDYDIFQNQESRYGAIQATFENKLKQLAASGDASAAAVLKTLAALPQDERERRLGDMSRHFMLAGEIQFEAMNGGTSLISYATASNRQLEAARRKELERTNVLSTIRSATAGSSLDADPIRRMMQHAREQAANENTDVGDVLTGMLSSALGIEVDANIGANLADSVNQVITADAELDKLRKQLGEASVAKPGETEPEKERRERTRRSLENQIKEKEAAYDMVGAQLKAIAEDSRYTAAYNEKMAEIEEQEKKAEEAAKSASSGGTGGEIGKIVFNNATFSSPSGIQVSGIDFNSTELAKPETVNGPGVANA
jgi:hypothetical protein